jgi:hypothetical protein
MYYQSIYGENGERTGNVRGKQRGKNGDFLLFWLQIWYYFHRILHFLTKVPKFGYFLCLVVLLFSQKL